MTPLAIGGLIVGVLWFTTVVVFQHAVVAERKTRYPGSTRDSVLPDKWWRDANVQAMRSNYRVRTWLKRGILLLIVGMSLVALGVFDTPGGPRSALLVGGLLLQAFGLVEIIAWTRLLAAELAKNRSGDRI